MRSISCAALIWLLIFEFREIVELFNLRSWLNS